MDQINEGLTYVLGENADVNGRVYGDWALDFFYYKDTPLWDDIFSIMRDTFWSILRPIISLLNS